MGWYFAFFFLSGFCSILYELVWLRLTMAQYGVTTALVSIMLSMFMLGLGAGSWGAGALVRRYGAKGRVPLRLYALVEFLIGCSSLAVPGELILGHRVLETFAGNSTMSSGTYYLASGALVALTLLPWCVCMGATYPLAMAAIEGDPKIESRRSFSYLYLSNVVGAFAGAVVPLFLIEVYGFHGTLRIGSLLNALIAFSAFGLSLRTTERDGTLALKVENAVVNAPSPGKGVLVLLFLTGLTTMGMEVIWIRLFTPYIGPLVYSFALILATYLVATFVGSILYRNASRKGDPNNPLAWVVLALVGLFPLITSDPRFPLNPLQHVCLGIAPFALLIGFLTPMLVDRYSAGNPDRAGRGYAVNVLGCILGPLLSGFILLPFVGEHISMLLYATPWMLMAFTLPRNKQVRVGERFTAYAIVFSALLVFFLTKDYETIYPQREVLRDSTATVIATGVGMHKHLITNGTGMTSLTPITKMMAHLTLASLDHQPRSALVICFGMGTTYRSVVSWGISATAAELVPSVPRLYPYFHQDAERILQSPQSHLVIDDGRRFMERTADKFDVIIVDPPPPIEAAASSLLYSDEFYAVAKQRLEPSGILAQWLPSGDQDVQASVAKALQDSFPYVTVYKSIEGWGWHFLASMRPIPTRSASELVGRMPSAAVTDMMEWGPAATPDEEFQLVLSKKMTTEQLIGLSPLTPAMKDDRPINEYFLLRRLAAERRGSGTQ
ncbi:MAG TPA: fused MFS/spermidine synthase [Terracidiphilus sp.]|jgi:spermidine synthase/MFS family permease|nr:fused MFS/spermidine synthase [Terracidiphilus sp.]